VLAIVLLGVVMSLCFLYFEHGAGIGPNVPKAGTKKPRARNLLVKCFIMGRAKPHPLLLSSPVKAVTEMETVHRGDRMSDLPCMWKGWEGPLTQLRTLSEKQAMFLATLNTASTMTGESLLYQWDQWLSWTFRVWKI